MRCSAGSGPRELIATARTNAAKGKRQAKKTATRITVFQFRGGFATELEALLFTSSERELPSTVGPSPALPSIEPGKIHSLIEVGYLLRIPVKHLGSHTIRIEQG